MAWVMLVLKWLSWLVSLVLTTLALKLSPSSMGVSLQGRPLSTRCHETGYMQVLHQDRLDASKRFIQQGARVPERKAVYNGACVFFDSRN